MSRSDPGRCIFGNEDGVRKPIVTQIAERFRGWLLSVVVAWNKSRGAHVGAIDDLRHRLLAAFLEVVPSDLRDHLHADHSVLPANHPANTPNIPCQIKLHRNQSKKVIWRR